MIIDFKHMPYKRSKQRDRLLELLKGTDTHPTADWLYQRLKSEFPRLSCGTVYRNLGVLREQDLVAKLPFGSTYDRYDARTAPHYHLICKKCGTVKDVEMPLYDIINRQARKISEFDITSHRIDFYGVCNNCKRKKKEKNHGYRKQVPGNGQDFRFHRRRRYDK